jgi:hypothetical protein
MDISFTCKCGQNIVIDEAGAGITVDCPQCGSPAYVPSAASTKVKDIPVRVETPLAKLMAKQAQTPSAPRPATSVFTPHKPEDIHPSIQASLACLLILAGFALIELIVLQQNMFAAAIPIYMATPFMTAAPLCAIYGMCVGHVKHGLLLLGAMSLMIGLSYWTFLRMMFGQLPH